MSDPHATQPQLEAQPGIPQNVAADLLCVLLTPLLPSLLLIAFTLIDVMYAAWRKEKGLPPVPGFVADLRAAGVLPAEDPPELQAALATIPRPESAPTPQIRAAQAPPTPGPLRPFMRLTRPPPARKTRFSHPVFARPIRCVYATFSASSAKWHAATCPGATSRSTGASRRHISRASAQRG